MFLKEFTSTTIRRSTREVLTAAKNEDIILSRRGEEGLVLISSQSWSEKTELNSPAVSFSTTELHNNGEMIFISAQNYPIALTKRSKPVFVMMSKKKYSEIISKKKAPNE